MLVNCKMDHYSVHKGVESMDGFGQYSGTYTNDFQGNLKCGNSSESREAKENVGENSEDFSISEMRSVSEIPLPYRHIFKEFPFFNSVQSRVMDDILYTNRPVVVCAPTGSGKTVIFELAIIRLLMECQGPSYNAKVIYMAPIKALCREKFEDWQNKFGALGIQCKELTGDTDVDDYFETQDAQIILTTPEKWDSTTRQWHDRSLVQVVRLFLIDEVHTVGDESRGATLEAVVSRMKTLYNLVPPTSTKDALQPLHTCAGVRIIALSATIPNIEDVAEWLSDMDGTAIFVKLDEKHRPVKLRKIVLGFPFYRLQTAFKFDLILNYKLAKIIQTYSEQKPTLIFCATRRSVQLAAATLAKDAKFMIDFQHRQRLQKHASCLKDIKLRDLLMKGIAYHHAGMETSDRGNIEDAFLQGELPVLFSTSTLAMGVNLPAHLVIVKSTMHYTGGGMVQEYGETDILQMIGRAGRPQFDVSATAVILTRNELKEKYEQMLSGTQKLESSLHMNLTEHLNAEIVLHTITDVNVALDWIRSTFLYIRALKNPKYYKFDAGLNKEDIEKQLLQELCLESLNSLAAYKLICMQNGDIKPTDVGRLMAYYYVAFDTIKLFGTIQGSEAVQDLVTLISSCREYKDITLRVNEKKTLNTLNLAKKHTIRFPMSGKIKTSEMKINCLIQAQLGCVLVQDFALMQDTAKIFRTGIRLTKCLAEFLQQKDKQNNFQAVLNAVHLAKCFRAKLWENSPFVLKQLEKIGFSMSSALVNAGLTSFEKIANTHGREIELIVNRHPPFGNQIKEAVQHLPKYQVRVEQGNRYYKGVAEVIITVILKNCADLQSHRTAPSNHCCTLLLGNADNNLVHRQIITDYMLLKTGSFMKKVEVVRPEKSDELNVYLLSSTYVGMDIHQNFTPFYSSPRTSGLYGNGRHQQAQSLHATTCEKPKAFASAAAQAAGNGYSAGLEDSKRSCLHNCKNKQMCGHECCKGNMARSTPLTPSTPSADVRSFLSELKSKTVSVTGFPSHKRLKVCSVKGGIAVNLSKFAHVPKPQCGLHDDRCSGPSELLSPQGQLAVFAGDKSVDRTSGSTESPSGVAKLRSPVSVTDVPVPAFRNQDDSGVDKRHGNHRKRPYDRCSGLDGQWSRQEQRDQAVPPCVTQANQPLPTHPEQVACGEKSYGDSKSRMFFSPSSTSVTTNGGR
ncbi:putative ATP-dependent DNA helicase HFM1 isoform X1 [Petromyzon marinus]|uniref:putative ATP-dependent DNA helicase HFM1 isoform X1 n=1 Tax=Petromyzon marinus TaxID=7757 RepID=UPI003F70F49B